MKRLMSTSLLSAFCLVSIAACDDFSVGGDDKTAVEKSAGVTEQDDSRKQETSAPEPEPVGPPGWQITLDDGEKPVTLEGEVVLNILQEGVTPKDESKFILKLSNPQGAEESDSARFVLVDVKPGDSGLYNTEVVAVFSETHDLECEPKGPIQIDLRRFTERSIVGTLSGKVTCDKKTYELDGEFRE